MKKEDIVYPGEEPIEERWKREKGIDPATGEMWLTPRMLRASKRLQEMWERQESERTTHKESKR